MQDTKKAISKGKPAGKSQTQLRGQWPPQQWLRQRRSCETTIKQSCSNPKEQFKPKQASFHTWKRMLSKRRTTHIQYIRVHYHSESPITWLKRGWRYSSSGSSPSIRQHEGCNTGTLKDWQSPEDSRCPLLWVCNWTLQPPPDPLSFG